MTDKTDPDYLVPNARWCILCGRDDSDAIHDKKEH